MEQYTDADGGAPIGAVLAGTWVDPHDYPGSENPRPAPTPQQTLTEVQTAMLALPTTSWSIPQKASSLTTTVATIVVTRIRSFLGISPTLREAVWDCYPQVRIIVRPAILPFQHPHMSSLRQQQTPSTLHRQGGTTRMVPGKLLICVRIPTLIRPN